MLRLKTDHWRSASELYKPWTVSFDRNKRNEMNDVRIDHWTRLRVLLSKFYKKFILFNEKKKNKKS